MCEKGCFCTNLTPKEANMKLRFEQTPEHLRDLQKQVFLRGRGKIYLIVIIGIILINIISSTYSEPQVNNSTISTTNFFAEALSWIIPFTIIATLWYFIFKLLTSKASIKKNSPTLIGSRELDISKENIYYKSDIFEGKFAWKGLSSFKKSKLCYFLHIGKFQAIIIPKSAFSSKEQEEEFVQLVSQKLKL